MQPRAFALTGWVIALLAVLGGAARGAAQQRVPDGEFVRAADGAVYAVSNGTRIHIAPLQDSGDLLAGLRDGPTATNVRELNDALAATAAPPPPPSTPADTLVGQRVSTCAFGTRFDVEVAQTHWVKTIGGRTAEGNSMWLVAVVNVTVTSNQQSLDPTRGATKVRDERDREFPNIYPTPLEDAITAEFEVQNPLNPTYRPGITAQVWMLFQVAGDVRQLTLLPSPTGYDCG